MEDEWFMGQIKIVDDFMQKDDIPSNVKHAYFHGVRGWICTQASKLEVMISESESPEPKETYEEIEKKQMKALKMLLPEINDFNLNRIIKAVENPEAFIGDDES